MPCKTGSYYIGQVNQILDIVGYPEYNKVSGKSLKCKHEGRENMSEIKVKDNESLDSALRRFKRQCAKSGVLAELRKREHYEKPSVKRKKKSEAARKRKFK